MARRGKQQMGVAQAALAVTACALCLQLPAMASGALSVGFYQSSCPNAETLVRQAVAAAVAKDAGIAAGLIRLHFHDCFVRGCDASVLLSVNPGGGTTERQAPPNFPSLRGFEVPAGRRDGTVSRANDTVDLPPPTATAETLTEMFAAKNLNLDEMVVLSGAHTVGRSFCNSFFDRVWDTNTRLPRVDDGLDPAYAAQLRALCPSDTTDKTLITAPMDPDTPSTMDNNYYKLLPRGRGLFFSDNQLRVNATMNALVTSFAANEALWKQRFADAMVKMGHIQVQTGSCGQIRLNCNVVNPTSVELPGEDIDAGVVAAS
ncbi:hypothetical protein GUJ93_ZPchr0001g30651 [Zizania palustris]|uniref:Plant heme peroxidase family profile domain-containing protein n=1 Tax=Zizania palustris TaxID=103762 RepID=A0A8J5SAL4_ZIZPA|nr:hypothetical protein GUJ93_ZPchr0001g30651 [Zizania palustris]